MTDNSFLSVYYEDQNYHKFDAVSESSTALLIIDLQNTYTKLGKTADTIRFSQFSQRLEKIVIPNTKKLLFEFRKRNMQIIYCRIASHLKMVMTDLYRKNLKAGTALFFLKTTMIVRS